MSEEKTEGSERTTEDLMYGDKSEDTTEVVDKEDADRTEGPSATEESTESADEKSAKEQSEESEGESKEAEVEELKLEDFEGLELKEEDAKKILDAAKELGLNKDQAKAFLDLKQEGENLFEQRMAEQAESLKMEWLEMSKNDPEIGGEKLQEHSEYSKRALEAYGAPEDLVEFLNETGLGNHPSLVKYLSKVGREVSEGKRVKGDSTGDVAKPKQDYELLYGPDEN